MRRRILNTLGTIRWRLTLFYVGVLCLFLLVLGIFLYASVRDFLYADTYKNLVMVGKNSRTRVIGALRLPVTTLDSARQAITKNPPGNGIVWAVFDDSGTPVIVPGGSGVILPPLQSAPFAELVRLRPREKNLSPGRVYRAYTADHTHVLVLLLPFYSFRAGVDGIVATAIPLTQPDTILGYLLATLGIGIGSLIILAVLVGIPLTAGALAPLRRMTATAQLIAAGDLKQRLHLPHGTDEIGTLAATFDEMIARIESAFAARAASEQQMRQFAADASHELRTPLTSIQGYTEVLRRGAKSDPEALDSALEAIEREAERMSRLVSDLLLLTRMDAGRPLQRQHLDLAQLAHEVYDQTSVLAPQLRVRFQPGPTLPVCGDPDHLRQVLLNLATNAIHYNVPGGSITFTPSRDKDLAVLRITDTGKGITATDLPHIFERFYRGHKARSRQDGGSGLGLAIAQSIMEAHQGRITVSSAGQGKGCTFVVSLPLEQGR